MKRKSFDFAVGGAVLSFTPEEDTVEPPVISKMRHSCYLSTACCHGNDSRPYRLDMKIRGETKTKNEKREKIDLFIDR